jgi:hypothetical protein
MKGGLLAATPLSVVGGSLPIGGRGWRRTIPNNLWGCSPATPTVEYIIYIWLEPSLGSSHIHV